MEDLRTDERWQLVQRIVSSAPFQKSTRLRELLQYIAQETLRGNAHELTEQHIGSALFHKPSGYSPLEDSSVRVHVRQLRLKLHEYFNEDGRNEPIILEIPRGSYAPIFRAVQKAGPVPVTIESRAIPVLDLALPGEGPLGPVRHSDDIVRRVGLPRHCARNGRRSATPLCPFLAFFADLRCATPDYHRGCG